MQEQKQLLPGQVPYGLALLSNRGGWTLSEVKGMDSDLRTEASVKPQLQKEIRETRKKGNRKPG